MFALFKACPRQDSNLRHRLYESLQALLVVVPKGVLNWRYNAIRHQPKPRRVADSPTKHRPRVGVGFRIRKRGRLGMAAFRRARAALYRSAARTRQSSSTRWWPGSTQALLPAPDRASSASTGGALPAALAADWLVSAWDQCAAFHSLSPAAAAIEEVASAWILDLLGLPATASVGFVTGGQGVNITCLAAARHAVL